jgi:hypothetical protein
VQWPPEGLIAQLMVPLAYFPEDVIILALGLESGPHEFGKPLPLSHTLSPRKFFSSSVPSNLSNGTS